jgi:cell division septation protein DedD
MNKPSLLGATTLVAVALTLLPSFALAQDYEAEIARILEDPAVQAAMEHIEDTDERTISDLIRLTEVPATAGAAESVSAAPDSEPTPAAGHPATTRLLG